MKRRKLFWAILLGAAVAIGEGAAIPYALDGNIRYHRLQYDFADAVLPLSAEWFVDSWVDAWLFEVKLRVMFHAMSQQEYHRQRLVDLGALACCRFELKNIKPKTRESEHLYQACWQGSPGYVDLTFWNCEPVAIQVWCDPSSRDAWERFVARYDGPNDWEIRNQSVALPEAASDVP